MDYQFHIVENIIVICENLSLKSIVTLLEVNKIIYLSILIKPIISSRVLDSEYINKRLRCFIDSNPQLVRLLLVIFLSHGTIRCEWLYNLIRGHIHLYPNMNIEIFISQNDYDLMYSKLTNISKTIEYRNLIDSEVPYHRIRLMMGEIRSEYRDCLELHYYIHFDDINYQIAFIFTENIRICDSRFLLCYKNKRLEIMPYSQKMIDNRHFRTHLPITDLSSRIITEIQTLDILKGVVYSNEIEMVTILS